MGKMANFEKLNKLIEMTVTPEGLQIELMEDPSGTFFENGSAEPTPAMRNLLKIISPEAGKLPNPISIEGHTDSKPYSSAAIYSNWELSTDRANAARRLMESNGLRPEQVVQVRGYADRKLRKPLQPEDASNRRVTVLIQYMGSPEQQSATVSNGKLPTVK
jgi:chemotaxis protein MotB